MRTLVTLAALLHSIAFARADVQVDLVRELRSIAAAAKSPPAPAPRRTCAGPTAAERADVTKRALAWIDAQHADERGAKVVARDDAALEINVGCKDSTGVILDVSQDRQPVKRGPDIYGKRRNYLMRVTPSAVEVLAEDTSTLSENWMEWADEGRIALRAQVDLDGDGRLDIVYSDHEHEGGSTITEDRLHVRYGNGTVGESGLVMNLDDLQVIGSQVIVAGSTQGGGPIYACLMRDLHLAPCAASVPLQKAADRREIVGRYSTMDAASVPDRELLAQELALLGVSAKRAAPLVAAAAATSPADRAERRVRAFLVEANLVEPAPMPSVIVQRHVEARTYLDALTAKLGDAPCVTTPFTPDETARANAWIRKQDANPVYVEIAPSACGPYVWAAWSTENDSKRREVMLGRDGSRILGFTYEPEMPMQQLFDHQESWFANGASTVGIVIAAQNLWIISDGKIVAQSKGTALAFYAYDDRWSERSVDVFVDGGTLWHATPSGREKLDLSLVRDHEARRAAIALVSQNPPTGAAKYVAALQLLGADKALVAEVKKLP